MNRRRFLAALVAVPAALVVPKLPVQEQAHVTVLGELGAVDWHASALHNQRLDQLTKVLGNPLLTSGLASNNQCVDIAEVTRLCNDALTEGSHHGVQEVQIQREVSAKTENTAVY